MLGTLLDDRYRLTAVLGRGAMGTVYRARDAVLDRDVAIKLLAPTLLDDDSRARFVREARVVGRLNHPNIVTLYDAGESDGTAYLVMELVEGRSLRELGRLPAADAVEIARQLCAALEHAHERGVVHRDLKPENVLAPMGPGPRQAKLTDFGLSSARDLSRLTQEGMIVGTLAYIAPEQIGGAAPDHRADLYSLGILLYELLTGRVPFRGPGPQLVVAQHLGAAPVAPRRLEPRIPEALEAIILRLLAKDAAARFPTAAALRAALDALEPGAMAAATGADEGAPDRPEALPQPLTDFVGREHEIAAARALFLRDAARLVTFTGPGGTGKTRLALRVAEDLAPRFTPAAAFVPLAAVSDPALVPASIARALGIHEAAGVAPSDAIRDHLRAKPMLLILDNFEHLLTAGASVAALVAACPGLQVLVTSRERLHLQGEREFPVPPLELPDPAAPHTISRLQGCPAVALFVSRARAVKPGFQVTEANASALARICTRLDGLPLAIELAAARVKLLAPAALAEQLGGLHASSLDLLTGGAADAPARQRTQRATIRWSYDLLDDAEKRVFARLAVFQGSFSLEGARAVCATSAEESEALLDTLGSLVDKSLVVVHETPGDEARFGMLETIREFARERLREMGEESTAERLHFAHALAAARAAEPELKGPRQATALDALERDLPNFRAALAAAMGRGEMESALQLCVALRWFWLMRGYSTEGRRWIRDILAAGGVSAAARAEAIHTAGHLAQNQGDLVEASADFEESLPLFRALDDRPGIAKSVGNLGVIALDRGDYDRAATMLEEGLELRRLMKDRPGEADALLNLSSVALCQGRLDRARALGEEALATMRALGNSHHASACIVNLGLVAQHEGDDARARALFEESLAIRRGLNDAHCSGNSLNLLARMSLEHGDPLAAEAQLRESVRLLISAGTRVSLAGTLEALAAVAVAREQWTRAARALAAAEAIRAGSGAARTPQEQPLYESTLAAVHANLDAGTLRAAWESGRFGSVETLLMEDSTGAAEAAPA